MNAKLKLAKDYQSANGVNTNPNNPNDCGYPTREMANEYARLQCEWWGSNLVYLGAEEKNGLFYPYFNVWD